MQAVLLMLKRLRSKCENFWGIRWGGRGGENVQVAGGPPDGGRIPSLSYLLVTIPGQGPKL